MKLTELYKKMKAETDVTKKLKLISLIACYRNMDWSIGIGELKRGFSIYIHPYPHKQEKFYSVAWVDNIPESFDKFLIPPIKVIRP